MDDLLRDFLTETGEHLDTVDRELVRLEQKAGDKEILRNIFRLVHTVKGTCGFLGLPRLEALAHAAETLMERLRDGMPLTTEAVTVILATIDRLKLVLAEIDRLNAEPPGNDNDLIRQIRQAIVAGEVADSAASEPAATPTFQAAAPALAEPVEPPPAEPLPASEPAEAPRREDRADERGARRSATIRIGVDTIEHLMMMVSELVLTRNQLLEISRRADIAEGYKVPLQRLSHVTAELQESVMKARMQPIGNAWAKLPRLLRDLSADLGKKIDLVMQGADTELDRQLLEVVRDPLTHMVRNSADHGIERPAERLAAGKAAKGTIRLNAFHEGGTITIEVADDGRGLDHDAIARQAVAAGLASEAEIARMPDTRIADFIFHPGFSTSSQVTSVSGRGVGMDVVRSNVDGIGGTIAITSERGRGTVFTIKIPLTLAIVASLIVAIGGQRFALPQAAVVELIRVRDGAEHRLERLDGSPVLRLRDELLPVLEGRKLLDMPAQDGAQGFVVVIQVGSRRFGLMVESVLETEEIVVKPMSAKLRHIAIFSGNTILGDGSVVLILDPNGVARQIGPELLREAAELPVSVSRRPDEADSMALLVFRAGGSLKAVPLSLVTRLEEVDAATIERAGDGACIQYRGRLMPILTLGGDALRQSGPQPLIVFSELGHAADPSRSVAIAVDEIVDIVEESFEIQPVGGRPDLVGSAIVRGRATEIVDVAAVLPHLGGPAGRAMNAPTVLLVDDEAFFRDMLGPVLKAAGYRVRMATGAEEALSLLMAHPVDVLVTDLELPARSGLQLVDDIRRQPRMAGLPVIMLASAAAPTILDRARDLDVFDVVAKFDRSGLLAALGEIGAPLEQAA